MHKPHHTFIYTLALGLALAGGAWAQSGGNTSRSGGIVAKTQVDETQRLDILRGEIQTPLNDFMSSQTTTIEKVRTKLDVWRSGVQEVCVLVLKNLEAAGATIPVTISVPAPGVVLSPEELNNFCSSVLTIDIPNPLPLCPAP